MLPLFEGLLLVFVVIAAVATALVRDVLGAIILFAAYSFGMALLWVILRAPDVALTEAAIGAGVTTILFLVTIARTVNPSYEGLSMIRIHWPTVAVVGLLAGVLAVTIGALPPIGDPSAPAWASADVSQYYIENAYSETGVENAVTAVLAAYRGFDTLGEAVVVFAAGIAVLVVLNEDVFA